MNRRRDPSPPPEKASPLDHEDLLREILLRLPPKPSSFPHASLVCKQWCTILSNPRFRRRFREHHRIPPLVGFFVKDPGAAPFFVPLLDPPDRIPVALLENFVGETPSPWDSFFFAGCRHGVALLLDRDRSEAVLWDPLTAVQCRVRLPPGVGFVYYGRSAIVRSAAVLCAASDDELGDGYSTPFKLVLACRKEGLKETLVCLYESNTGVWGDLISVVTTTTISMKCAGVLVGNTICWLLLGGDILEFDLERQTLVVIDKPTDLHIADPGPHYVGWYFQILRGEGGGLGLAVFSDPKQSIQLWARKSNCDGVVSWVLQKTVQLDERFSQLPGCMDEDVMLSGYDEDTNAIFLCSVSHDFMLQLESMQFTYLRREEYARHRIYHPYTSFYTAGRGIVGGDDGAENVNA